VIINLDLSKYQVDKGDYIDGTIPDAILDLIITEKTISEFKEFLGDTGIYFITQLIQVNKLISIHNTVEGRQIRNWMRSQEEFKEFSDQQFSDNWMTLAKWAFK